MRERLPETAQRLKLQVAIDGPAGAGKSTVGRDLSAVLGCPFLDTGLMYRAITWLALQQDIPLTDESSLGRLAEETAFSFATEPGVLLVNGHRLDEELSGPAVEASVSTVSMQPAVRAALVQSQRRFAADSCIVMIGRDIGTVVLPDAPAKLWVTASPEERARRRLAERGAAGDGSSGRELALDLLERDRQDATRTVSPSVPAKDAVVLDTEKLTREEMADEALRIVEQALDELSSVA